MTTDLSQLIPVSIGTGIPEGTLVFEGEALIALLQEMGLKQEGVVGLRTDPHFKLTIQNAGINEPEYRLDYLDAAQTIRKVFGIESTGTAASVRNVRGSHFEAFVHDGGVDPICRLNSSPAMTLEMGAGDSKCLAGGLVRSSNVVTGTTTEDHGFGVGETMTLSPGEPGFLGGQYTIASVPTSKTFTYSSAGTDGASTGVQYVSTPTDMGLKRAGHWEMHFIIGGSAKAIIYADAFVVQADTRLVAAGGFDLWSHDGSGTTGNQTINNPSGFFKVAAGQQSVTITNNKVGANSKVFCVLQSDDATMTGVKCVTVPSAGSFVFKGNAICTADTKVAFQVLGSVDV